MYKTQKAAAVEVEKKAHTEVQRGTKCYCTHFALKIGWKREKCAHRGHHSCGPSTFTQQTHTQTRTRTRSTNNNVNKQLFGIFLQCRVHISVRTHNSFLLLLLLDLVCVHIFRSIWKCVKRV